jgi:hypothetical protein
MNNLEQIKQQLIVKPPVKDREQIAVVIKGNKSRKKPKTEKHDQKKEEKEEVDEGLEEGLYHLGEQISSIQQMQGILPTSIDAVEIGEGDGEDEDEEQISQQDNEKPLIIDKTSEGYDRATLLEKLKKNKMSLVTAKLPLDNEPDIIEQPIQIEESKKRKKPKKMAVKMPLIIEDDDDDDEKQELQVELPLETAEKIIEQEIIPIVKPKEKKRRTKKVEKGVAVLGPEVAVEIGDTELPRRLQKKTPPIILKASSYVMNNREIFVNFINSLYEPYKRELEENKESISCDTIGKVGSDFSLLTHQKIVRDYMNLYTPYRGLLLYHGLGSGKTCTSIAIAEGMKTSKNIVIMTPASLRANYIGELKKCGDLLYKKNQYWDWISIDEYPDTLETMSAVLNLPREYISKQSGAFFINVSKKSNYDSLSDRNKILLDDQLNEMIKQKYKFINYNGLRDKGMKELTSNYTRNIFDNSVIIIDEAHNFISRIVNKLKKEKPIAESKRGEKERLPISLSVKLYEMLLSAKNAKIILLTGTPIINYPNEMAILFNILRGYIKTWSFPLVINTTQKVDRETLKNMLLGEKTLDYLDFSPSTKTLIITRNPFGFKNKIKKDSGYQGVSNTKKNENNESVFETDYISDDEFERKIINILRRNDIDIVSNGIQIKYRKALPDTFDEFVARYVDETTRKLKNEDALKRRILGLSSYFRSAQESLLPRFEKQLGVDYHIINIPMSDVQFRAYENARIEERKSEKKRPKQNMSEDYKDQSSTYRIFSRLYCNFIIPERPIPLRSKKAKDEEKDSDDGEKAVDDTQMVNALKQCQNIVSKQDIQDNRVGEIEGDEVLQDIGGTTYMERLQNKIKEMADNSDDYFTPEALETYSPKFLHILENIQDPEYQGLHLVYSQFRTAEGIGLLTLVLNKNGFAQFKIKKNNLGIWKIDISEKDKGKPTYALYTGTETGEEKEIVRKIYNGEWDDIPDSIGNELKASYRNNNMGEVIKVFMITSSGSEGINLRNTRYVHIMDPYWHPVRSEQVIGRARRICSHKDLPQSLQTVEVFVYLMVFTKEQLLSDEAIELKRKDLSKAIPRVPITSDQYLFEISEIKANLSKQLTDSIKETSFDCYIYSNGKCFNFSDPTIDYFSYVPNYAEQQNDTIVQANKQVVQFKVKPITINGVEYVYQRLSPTLLKIYDKKSYEDALKDPNVVLRQVGTYDVGERVFREIVY